MRRSSPISSARMPSGRATLFAVALTLACGTGLAPHAFAQEPTSEPSGEVKAEKASLDWVLDFDAAKQRARAEGKDILIDFTGSDWCIWCKRLEGEVMEHAPFVEYAKENFVLVYLDYPNSPEAKAKVPDPERNDQLAKDYGVAAFPTILLTDADGNPYGKTGYQPGGPEAYVTHLTELRTLGAPIRALTGNNDEAREAELIEKAFPAMRAQELFGFTPYQPYLDAAEKIPALADQVASVRQNAELAKRMQNPEEPDWAEFHTFLAASKHLSGMPFLQASFATVERHLLPEKKYDEAIALLTRVLADPAATSNAKAKEFFEGKLAEVKTLRDGGGEADGHDHDGHDHDDHDHDDHEGHDHP